MLDLGDYLSTLVNKPVSKMASTAFTAVSRETKKSRGTGKSWESGDTCRGIQDIGSKGRQEDMLVKGNKIDELIRESRER